MIMHATTIGMAAAGQAHDNGEHGDARSHARAWLDGRKPAQAQWAGQSLRHRRSVLRRFRDTAARQANALAASLKCEHRHEGEKVLSEVLPLLDACAYLEKTMGSVLRSRRRRAGRPLWLWGTSLVVRREPFGQVLIIAAGNYPLQLAGIQALQALAAGNAVLLKPPPGQTELFRLFAALLHDAGVPDDVVHVLDEDPATVEPLIKAGVDKIVVTGSASTGRNILRQTIAPLTPCIMELSGCDAAFIRADADVELAARALTYSMTFNGSRTCIAPRRIFVHQAIADDFEKCLLTELASCGPVTIDNTTRTYLQSLLDDALRHGASLLYGHVPLRKDHVPLVIKDMTPDMAMMQADIFAPVLMLMRVADDQAAMTAYEPCPYRLGAVIFGDQRTSQDMVCRLDAGLVLLNDVIVPLSDPRVPLQPRGESGFGVTRGTEGLLAMTRLKAVSSRRGRSRPHYRRINPMHSARYEALLQLIHCRGLWPKLHGLVKLIHAPPANTRTTAHQPRHGD